MKLLIKIIYIVLLIFLLACRQEQVRVSFNESFLLHYVQTRPIESEENLYVTFTSLMEDSRCPADVVCIWAGQARVLVTLQSGDLTAEVELGLGENETSISQWQNYVIELEGLMPYPKNDVAIPIEDYRIQLTVYQK